MTTVSGLGEPNMAGHTVATDGNVQVDFVWGNLPLQPNDYRGGEGQSDTLDYTLDNHSIADIGWSNYPGYIPNYSGDEDSQLEVLVPDFVRLTRDAANDLANANGLELFDISHYLTVQGVESTGKTVRVFAYDTDYGDWSNQSDAALIGLKPGDELYFTGLEIGGDPVDFGTIKVTKVNNDGSNSWFEFKLATEPEVAYDASAIGSVWAGPNLVNVITVQRPNNTAPGDIVNFGRNVNVRYFALD